MRQMSDAGPSLRLLPATLQHQRRWPFAQPNGPRELTREGTRQLLGCWILCLPWRQLGQTCCLSFRLFLFACVHVSVRACVRKSQIYSAKASADGSGTTLQAIERRLMNRNHPSNGSQGSLPSTVPKALPVQRTIFQFHFDLTLEHDRRRSHEDPAFCCGH